MHVSSQNASALARGFVVLLLAYGCGSNPAGPLDPALSGNWFLPSVDTYSMLMLQQRGTLVGGTFGDYTANQSFSEVFILSGTADLPHVVLRWVQGGVNETFDARLSADQDSLVGVIDPGAYAVTFLRDRRVEGRAVASRRAHDGT